MLYVDLHIQIPESELRLTFSRSGGPGGQNVNKVNTKVTLHWNVRSSPHLPEDVRQRFLQKYPSRISNEGDVVLSSQKGRDQLSNRQDCLEKLRQLILTVRHPAKRRRATRPSAASRQRRLREKRKKSDKKKLRKPPPPE